MNKMNFNLYKILFKQFNSRRLTSYYKEIDISEYKSENSLRLDKFLLRNFKINWGVVQKLIRMKKIFVIRKEGNKVFDHTIKLEFTDKLYIPQQIIQEEELKTIDQVKNLDDNQKHEYKTLFNKMKVLESKNFVVLNKFNNLATQGGTKMKFSIDSILKVLNLELAAKKIKQNQQGPINLEEYRIAHRIDKPVSGLVVIAKNINFAREFSNYQQERKSEKIYISLNTGIPKYLREMIGKNLLNINNKNGFLRSFSGLISSNENADKFILKIDNGYYFTHGETLREEITGRNLENEENSIDEMMGKFSITHLIFFDKKFKIFSLVDVDQYDYEKKQDLMKYLKNEKIECHYILLYELNTGKKHQIRKHLSKCFFTPIFNDDKYLFNGENSELYNIFISLFKPKQEEEMIDKDNILDRYRLNCSFNSIYLHSLQLKFNKLIEGEKINFVSKYCTFQEKNDVYIVKTFLPKNFDKLLYHIQAQEIIKFYNSDIYLNLI
jgi:23S rRNA-/tRNA-specific pseudouridylate synthase